MELKIVKQEKNPFLEREEFTLEITNEVTPSFEEVKQELKKDTDTTKSTNSKEGEASGNLGALNPDLTIVKKVNTNFGRRTFIVEAVVYDNKEAMKKVETIPQKVRKKMEADEKAAVEAAKKAEAVPAEEPKEETPEEETKETPEEETKSEPEANA